jgi:YHS domain-containing protein
MNVRSHPVCAMRINPAKVAATREHRGTTYHFCFRGCAQSFDNDADAYFGRRRQGIARPPPDGTQSIRQPAGGRQPEAHSLRALRLFPPRCIPVRRRTLLRAGLAPSVVCSLIYRNRDVTSVSPRVQPAGRKRIRSKGRRLFSRYASCAAVRGASRTW